MKARKEYDCNSIARCLSPDCGKTLCEANDCHVVRVLLEADYRKLRQRHRDEQAVIKAAVKFGESRSGKNEMALLYWVAKMEGGKNE